MFWEYDLHIADDRGLEQNTVKTYYTYVSVWCGWCVNEGYLDAAYETFEQAHEHERELAQVVAEATTPERISPVNYTVAIALLVLLLILITGLWLGVL